MGGWRDLGNVAMKLPPTIRPVLLDATTPTKAEALRACPLRAAFDASPIHQQMAFRGPAARLGSACHAVLEATGRGCFDRVPPEELEVALEQLWREQIKRQEEEAQRSPLEQHFGPAGRWPYYAIKRSLLFRLAKQLADARRGASSGERGEVERSYVGFGGRLKGRADHVVPREGHIEIEDYKSGAIVDTSDSGEREIKGIYRRQLLLYAALHWQETGAWPRTAHAISLQGERATVDVSPEEAMALVRETLERLDVYNRQVEAGMLAEDIARPSMDTCLYCSYKPMCEPFWESVAPGWDLRGAAYIGGWNATIEHLGQYGSILGIQATQGNLLPGRYRLRGLTRVQFPDLADITEGAHVYILSARIENPRNPPLDLLPGAYTQLWWNDT